MNTHDKIELPPPAQRIPYIGDVWTRDQVCAAIEADRKRRSEPKFWYRPRTDGCYEGPIHNAQIDEVRKQSGGWVPLYEAPQPAEPVKVPSAPYSIDDDPAGIRARAADAITGAMAFGAQGVNPPPEGHWLTPFWQIGRAEAERSD